MRVGHKADKSQVHVEVLARGEIPFNDLSPKPGGERSQADPYSSAPIKGDATERNPQRHVEIAPPKRYRVTTPNGKFVQDSQTQNRVWMHEGKELSSSHFNVADLRRQGLRVVEIDAEGNDVVAAAPAS